jgi:uncharacterized membrane protein YccC
MPYLIRITVAVALVAALMVWLLGALPLPLALLLAVIVGWPDPEEGGPSYANECGDYAAKP